LNGNAQDFPEHKKIYDNLYFEYRLFLIKKLGKISKMKVFSILVGMLMLISCAQAPTGRTSSYGNSESHNNLTKEELRKMEDDESPPYY
jgi:hypothetical protein